MSGRHTWRIAIAAVCVFAFVGCGDPTTSGQSGQNLDRADVSATLPTEFLFEQGSAVEVSGELVAAEQYSGDGTAVVAVRKDGTVRRLPDAPALQSKALISVEGAVAIVGVSCVGDGPCESAELVALTLGKEQQRWTPLKVDSIAVVEDSVVAHVGGSSERPVISVAGQRIAYVPGEGLVQLPELDRGFGPLGFRAHCGTAGESVVYVLSGLWSDGSPVNVDGEIDAALSGEKRIENIELHSLRLDQPERSWTAIEPPPLAGAPLAAALLCNGSSPVVVADGSDYELVDGTWRGHSDIAELKSVDISGLHQVNTAVDGAAGIATTPWLGTSILLRGADGTWRDSGITGSSAVTSSTPRSFWVIDTEKDTASIQTTG